VKLTVFTPTYNRKELLKRTYESMLRQTCKDFEWLIVDDGSVDNTKEEVEGWIAENKIDIRYYYRENGGKMRAHNMGVELAACPLFVCVDSDDYLTDDAVEVLIDSYKRAKKEYPDKNIGGVVCHKGKSETELLSACDFPKVSISTLYGLYLNGFSGETTLMYETDILKKYPFPEIDGEKYVPEDYIYDKIDSVCVLAVVPRIVTVCELVEEGYTDSVARLKADNKMAWYLYYEQRARITPFGTLKIKYLGRYIIFAHRTKQSVIANKSIGITDKLLGYCMAAFLKVIHKE